MSSTSGGGGGGGGAAGGSTSPSAEDAGDVGAGVGVGASSSSSSSVGFHVRDGPVPIGREYDDDVDNRQSRRRAGTGEYGSLMDPFYVPPTNNQTHLLQGGIPSDVPDAENARPYMLAEYGEGSVYTLILLRHGESEWNATNRYTGWCDVKLTRRGEGEARAAGRLLAANGIEVDHAFTSVLRRASYTTNMCLNMAGQHWVPVTKTWRLNERHYGALQGYNKDDAWRELDIDQELVMEMRRSYNTPPPRMDDDHPYWHGNDRRYAKLTPDQLERSRCESLKDAAERIMPFFNSVIVPSLREGNRCLVVSHANTIRTLIKQIDNISDQDIKQLSIPTGIPLIYRLDQNMRPVDPNCELEFRYLVRPKGYTWATSRQHGFHGVYLGDLERLQDIQKKRDATNRGWQRVILRNIARQSNEEDILEDGNRYHNPNFHRDGVVETKHLWWKIVQKMQNPEVSAFRCLVPRHICP
jgi:2,3-bisphosphoglycerate-dependent phosphoglycerate mutase